MKRSEIVFLIAGSCGLVAAFIGAVGAPKIDYANDPAAVVNGVPIPREALARAVLALDADSRNPVTLDRQVQVRERLIEEELLVQHGVELGLAESDFAARRALVQSVMSLAIAQRAGDDPSEAQLRQFYLDNRGFFAAAPRFAASVVYISNASDTPRLESVHQKLTGGADSRGLGDPLAIPLPRGPLDQAQWARLIGPDAAAAAARLSPGEVTAPIASGAGAFVVRVNGFVAEPAPPFEQVEPQVRAEWERRADERAVREYIAQLKRTGRVERGPMRPMP